MKVPSCFIYYKPKLKTFGEWQLAVYPYSGIILIYKEKATYFYQLF